jgi:K+-sensing histidine kinase KdpD
MTNNNSQIPTILVCIDGANGSTVTLRYACHKAKRGNFAVRILAVIEASHRNLLFGSRAIGHDKRKQLENHLKKIIEQSSNETGITPTVSIREGDIVSEIIREVRSVANCTMLIFGKSYNSLSDNNVLPKIAHKIGNKIRIPIAIVPENLDDDFFERLV